MKRNYDHRQTKYQLHYVTNNKRGRGKKNHKDRFPYMKKEIRDRFVSFKRLNNLIYIFNFKKDH